jgi:hypothetical protein
MKMNLKYLLKVEDHNNKYKRNIKLNILRILNYLILNIKQFN